MTRRLISNLLLSQLMLFVSLNKMIAQGHEIRIQLNGLKDSTVYLARYYFDQVPVMDSCKHIQNGKIHFAGTSTLEPGVYIIANQQKNNLYCQFIVDKQQKFTMTAEASDPIGTMKTDEKLNKEFFNYVNTMNSSNRKLAEYREKQRGKSDSAKAVMAYHTTLNKDIVAFDSTFMARNKGTFVFTLLNLKNDHYPKVVPKASNGRPDSVYQYNYFKAHYFDDVDFKDKRIIFTPFFADRIKSYFDRVIVHHPDTVIKELDKILGKCEPGGLVFNTLVGHFTYKYETNKEMSFDKYGKSNTFEKVFVHLSERYIVSGMTKDYYTAETVKAISERIKILKNLLPGAHVQDLYVIDTTDGAKVLKMGFDTAHTSQSCTYLYNKNYEVINPMFKHLYDVKAKYTVLLFWAADCGHCQTEVPRLSKELKDLKGTIDFKVFAVQTKEELCTKWKSFIIEKQLTDFIHVFDPVHVNNLKENFDIQGTPVIYLLDRDKNIIAKKLASEDLVGILKKLEEIEKNLNKQ